MKLIAEMTVEERDALINSYPCNWDIEDIVLDRYQKIEVRIIKD